VSVGGDWISLGEREIASFNYVDENTLSTSTSFDKSGRTFPEIEENRTSSGVEQLSQLFTIFPALDRGDCGVLSRDSMNNSESNSQQIVQPPKRERTRTEHSKISERTTTFQSPEKGSEKKMGGKLSFILSCDDTRFGNWEECYGWSQTDDIKPDFLRRNNYPSPDKPVLIPLFDCSSTQDIIQKERTQRVWK
jgi:hypothetical protein